MLIFKLPLGSRFQIQIQDIRIQLSQNMHKTKKDDSNNNSSNSDGSLWAKVLKCR